MTLMAFIYSMLKKRGIIYHPDVQGMTRMLMKEMLNYMEKVGVDTARSLVSWRDSILCCHGIQGG